MREDGLQVLRANNIDLNGTLNLSDIKQVSKTLAFKDTKKLRKNDIFICLASGSKDHIGKTAFVDTDTDYYFGGFMGAVRTTRETILPEYLYSELSSVRWNDYLRQAISGVNINNLNGTILSNYEIPLPPLETQKQFVAEFTEKEKWIQSSKEAIAYMERAIAKVLSEL